MKAYVLRDNNFDIVESGYMVDLINLAKSKVNSITSFTISKVGIKSIHDGADRITEINIPEDTKEEDIRELARLKVKEWEPLRGQIELENALWEICIDAKKEVRTGSKFESMFYGTNSLSLPMGREETVWEKIADKTNSNLEKFLETFNPNVYITEQLDLSKFSFKRKLDLQITKEDVEYIETVSDRKAVELKDCALSKFDILLTQGEFAVSTNIEGEFIK